MEEKEIKQKWLSGQEYINQKGRHYEKNNQKQFLVTNAGKKITILNIVMVLCDV